MLTRIDKNAVQAEMEAKQAATTEAHGFWLGVPGFEKAAGQFLDDNNKLIEDDLHKATGEAADFMFVQAQHMYMYRHGLTAENIGNAKSKHKDLLKPVSELSLEEKEELVNSSLRGIGWFNNNIVATGEAAYQLTSDDTPAAQKIAFQFWLDLDANMAFNGNKMNKFQRFAVQGFATDPGTWGAVIVGAVSFGAGGAAVKAATEGGKLAAKTILKNFIKDRVKSGLVRKLAVSGAKAGVFGALEASTQNSLEQNAKMATVTLDDGTTFLRQENFSLSHVAMSGTIGFGAGAAFGMAGAGAKPLVSWAKGTQFGQTTGRAVFKVTNPVTNTFNRSVDGISNRIQTFKLNKNGGATGSMIRNKNSDLIEISTHGKGGDDALGHEMDHALFDIMSRSDVPAIRRATGKFLQKMGVRGQGHENVLAKWNGMSPRQQRVIHEGIADAQTAFKATGEYPADAATAGFLKQMNAITDGKGMKYDNAVLRDRLASEMDSMPHVSAEAKDAAAQKLANLYSMMAQRSGKTVDEVAGANRVVFKHADKAPTDLLSRGFAKSKTSAKSSVGHDMPAYKTGISWRTRYVMWRTWHSKAGSVDDMLRVSARWFPMDSHKNLGNIIDSMDSVFKDTAIHKKILALQKEITAKQLEVSNKTLTLPDAQKEIKILMADFATDNAAGLKKMETHATELAAHVDVKFFERENQEIFRWSNIVKSGEKVFDIGRKGINAKQKADVLKYLNDMKNVAKELQKPDFGDEGVHLATSTADTVGLSLNRIHNIAHQAHLRTEGVHPVTGKKSNFQEGEQLRRALRHGVYSDKRPTNGSGIPQDPGNLESLVDVDIKRFMEDKLASGKAEWSDGDYTTFASKIQGLLDANMPADAIFAIQYAKFKCPAAQANFYQDGWLAKIDFSKFDSKMEADIKFYAQSADRPGGDVGPLFGIEGLGAAGGGRRAEEFYMRQMELWLFKDQFKGDAKLSTPFRGNVFKKARGVGHAAASHILGGVKKVDDKGNVSYWNISNPDATGKINVLNRNAFAWAVRVPARLAVLPIRTGYEISKVGYQHFASPFKLGVPLFGGLMLVEEGIESLTDSELSAFGISADFGSRGLGGINWVADKASTPIGWGMDIQSAAFKYFTPLDGDGYFGTGKSGNELVGSVFDGIDHVLQNVAGDRGGRTTYLGSNFFIGKDIDEEISFYEFAREDLGNEIKSATGAEKMLLEQRHALFSAIIANKEQLETNIKGIEQGITDQEELIEELKKQKALPFATPRLYEQHLDTLEDAEKDLDDLETELEDAEEEMSVFAYHCYAYSETAPECDILSEDIAYEKDYLNNNAVVGNKQDRINSKIAEMDDELTYKTGIRDKALTYFVGLEAARLQKTGLDQEAATALAITTITPPAIEQVDVPAEEEAPAAVDPLNISPAPVSPPLFVPPALATGNSTAANIIAAGGGAGTAADAVAAANNTGSGSNTGNTNNNSNGSGDTTTPPAPVSTTPPSAKPPTKSLSDTFRGWVGDDVADTLTGALHGVKDFGGSAIQAFQDSKNPWVKGGGAVLAALLGVKVLFGGKEMLSNLWKGSLKIGLFAALAVGLWAWMRPKGAETSEDNMQVKNPNYRGSGRPARTAHVGQTGREDGRMSHVNYKDLQHMESEFETQNHDGIGMKTPKALASNKVIPFAGQSKGATSHVALDAMASTDNVIKMTTAPHALDNDVIGTPNVIEMNQPQNIVPFHSNHAPAMGA